MVAERGEGAMLYDADGNSFIDCCGSWGALIHGHAHPEVLAAAQKRMMMGTTFGITTEIEEKLARKIIQHIPSIEKIRFVSSGTEATMSAARLARGFTRREIIVKFTGHYHGHADFFLVQAGSGVSMCPQSSSAGIPAEIVQHTICLEFNDCDALQKAFEAHGHQIAAVIFEPIAGNMGAVESTRPFMALLRELTTKYGALLIYDEVMTGFRIGLGGAQAYYNIKPDLTCLAKIIGGGFPAAAFGGRRDIMDCLAPIGPVYQAGTLSGNPVAMEAGLKAIEMLEAPGFYEKLAEKCARIVDPVKAHIEKKGLNACFQGQGSMICLYFGKKSVHNWSDVKQLDSEKFAAFFRFMFAHGVYIPPLQHEAWFLSNAHTPQQMDRIAELTIAFMDKMDTH